MDKIAHFKIHFKDRGEISLSEIVDYFHGQGKTNYRSIMSLLSKWTARNVLARVKKGVYEITDENKSLFKFPSDILQKKAAELFTEQYPELKYAVWNTDGLNRLTVHQHFASFYLFETEADVLESVFYLFKESDFNVFMADDENVLQRYMNHVDDPIVIKKLISRSPLTCKDSVYQPTLEKVLVDIFADRTLFDFVQGAELSNIYNRAFSSYVVNTTKLLNYADRRKVRAGIADFIGNHVNNRSLNTLL